MIEINLLPYEKRRDRRAVFLLVLLGCVLAVMISLLVWDWISLTNEETVLEQQQKQLNVLIGKRTEQLHQQSTNIGIQGAATQLKNGRIEIYPIIDQLSQALTKGSTIADFQYNSGGGIVVQCTFPTLNDTSAYLKTLQSNTDFSEVRLSQITNLSPSGKKSEYSAGYTIRYNKTKEQQK